VGAALLLPEGVIAGEGGDSADPVVERAGSAVFRKICEDFDENLLSQIFRCFRAGKVAADDSDD